MRKNTRRFLLLSGILAGLLLISVAIVCLYFNNLFGLLDRSEMTGDPNIPEIELIEPSAATASPTQAMTVPTTAPTVAPAAVETAIPTPVMTLSTLPIPEDKNVYNILLIGTDNRGDEINGRSDCMIILSINKRTRKIHLASLMRGLYVQIEGHDYSMLNNAFSWGGPRRLLITIEDNLRTHISDYVVVDFGAFKQAIDLVGGVDISLTVKEAAYLAEAYPEAGLAEGANHLDGELALAYARIRHIDSDFRRTGRQRKIIECLIHKMAQMDAAKLDGLARQLLPLLHTNLKNSTLASLLVNSPKYKNYPVSQLMLPITGTYETIVVRGIQMIDFDVNTNIEALHQFLYEN